MWYVAAATVAGPSHAATGNEDAVEFLPAAGIGRRVQVAIADGHGGEAYIRSGIGARLAVGAALSELTHHHARNGIDLDAITRRIVERWRRLVDADLERDPIDGGMRTYGTTLLAVAAEEDLIACSQIGDGHILLVDDSGLVSSPLPDDPRLVGNLTTSLAGSEPIRDARMEVLTADSIRLVLACTDGYENSFADEASFFQAASDLLTIAEEHGVEVIRRQLPAWLAETTSAGSGDDTSVAVSMHEPEPRRR
ncbi:MAG: PP2C family serine/threonine-protein phosphatase [Acidimicrobiia bacterium]